MSRCFPFPPPGYEGKNKQVIVPDEAALIQESIKREQDKAEKERKKERKREKKEKKRKEKEEKLRLKGGHETEKHKHKGEGTSAGYQKQKECEIEQLERSGLSEEHGPPSAKLCDSSDSTQNSGKRKKPSSPLEGSHGQSTMLRIRLPNVVKQKDPEKLHTKEQLCSSAVQAENTSVKRAKIDSSTDTKQKQPSIRLPIVVKEKDQEELHTKEQLWSSSVRAENTSFKKAKIDPSTDTKQKQPSTVSGRSLDLARCSSALGTAAVADISPPARLKQPSSISRRFKDKGQCSSEPGVVAAVACHPSLEHPCSTSGRTEVPAQDKFAVAPPVELNISDISSLSDKQLRRVLQKWIPPVIEMEAGSGGDMDWLFDAPPRREPVMPKVSHVATCHEGSSLWPKARYLPEADIYALPYTVPF